jgi:hypothetical protein
MQTLVEKLWFADCDMTALATAQADAKKGTTTKIVLGNRPITPRILDVQSKNHAWNVRSEQDRWVVSDNTRSVNPVLEYFGTQFHADVIWKGGVKLPHVQFIQRLFVPETVLPYLPGNLGGSLVNDKWEPEFLLVTHAGSENIYGTNARMILATPQPDQLRLVWEGEKHYSTITGSPKKLNQPYVWMDYEIQEGVVLDHDLLECVWKDVQKIIQGYEKSELVYETGRHNEITLSLNSGERLARETLYSADIPGAPYYHSVVKRTVPEKSIFELSFVSVSRRETVRLYTVKELNEACKQVNGKAFERTKILRGTVLQD